MYFNGTGIWGGETTWTKFRFAVFCGAVVQVQFCHYSDICYCCQLVPSTNIECVREVPIYSLR